MFALSTTSFHFIPRFSEGKPKFPFVRVSSNSSVITSINWPICEDGVDGTNFESCKESWPAQNIDILLFNISAYVNTTSRIINPESLVLTNCTSAPNGTFCSLINPNFDGEEPLFSYEIINHPEFQDNCALAIGNYMLTFWLVMFVSLIAEVSISLL